MAPYHQQSLGRQMPGTKDFWEHCFLCLHDTARVHANETEAGKRQPRKTVNPQMNNNVFHFQSRDIITAGKEKRISRPFCVGWTWVWLGKQKNRHKHQWLDSDKHPLLSKLSTCIQTSLGLISFNLARRYRAVNLIRMSKILASAPKQMRSWWNRNSFIQFHSFNTYSLGTYSLAVLW